MKRFFTRLSNHFKIKSLQNQFDEQVIEVKQLMAEGKIKASGKALLEAERLRKEIEQLEGLAPPEEDEVLGEQQKQDQSDD